MRRHPNPPVALLALVLVGGIVTGCAARDRVPTELSTGSPAGVPTAADRPLAPSPTPSPAPVALSPSLLAENPDVTEPSVPPATAAAAPLTGPAPTASTTSPALPDLADLEALLTEIDTHLAEDAAARTEEGSN